MNRPYVVATVPQPLCRRRRQPTPWWVEQKHSIPSLDGLRKKLASLSWCVRCSLPRRNLLSRYDVTGLQPGSTVGGSPDLSRLRRETGPSLGVQRVPLRPCARSHSDLLGIISPDVASTGHVDPRVGDATPPGKPRSGHADQLEVAAHHKGLSRLGCVSGIAFSTRYPGLRQLRGSAAHVT
jgi:hypothetical protein